MRQNRGICSVGAGCGGRKRKSDFHVSDGRICRIWQKPQRLSLSERWISRTDFHAAGIVNFIIAQDARRCIENAYPLPSALWDGKENPPLSRSNVSTSKQGIHLLGDSLTVAVPDCIKQSIPIPLLCAVIEPFDDGRFKDFFDFCIRDHQSDHPVRQFALIILFSRLGQVSCQIQRTPEIIFRRMQIVLRSLFLFYLRCILSLPGGSQILADGSAEPSVFSYSGRIFSVFS